MSWHRAAGVVVLAGWLGTACNGDAGADKAQPADDSTAPAVDVDGDGYGESTDCDDASSAIYPGADEACDGVDNDCDGLVDEPGATGGSTYPLDQDGDGYGHPTQTGTACAPGDGYADNNTDCDDQDPSRSPGLPELCSNDQDDDCDGTIDEVDDAEAPTWYYDGDDDGYGVASPTVESCDQPDGYADNADDCDDGDPDTNPDAPDRTDGVDNDCNGTIDDGPDYDGVGTFEYKALSGRTTICDIWFDITMTSLDDPCPDCEYSWALEHTLDYAASTDAESCGISEDYGSFTWYVGLDEEYYISGYGVYEVMWYYFADYETWYPVYLAYWDSRTGELGFGYDGEYYYRWRSLTVYEP